MIRQIRSSKIKTAPTSEPLILTDVKPFLDIDSSDTEDDVLITSLMRAARNRFEEYTSRRLIQQDWYLYLNDWPSCKGYEDEIELPGFPLISITGIKYYDENGTEYTFAATDYRADVSTEPGRVVLNYNKTWPTSSLRLSQGIEIEYRCGYGSSHSSVPPDIQLILKMLVQNWFHNRSEANKIPDEIRNMMDEYRILFL